MTTDLKIADVESAMRKLWDQCAVPLGFTHIDPPLTATQVRAALLSACENMLKHREKLGKVSSSVRLKDRISGAMSERKRSKLGKHAERRMKQFREGSRGYKYWSRLAGRCGTYVRVDFSFTPNEPCEMITVDFAVFDKNVVLIAPPAHGKSMALTDSVTMKYDPLEPNLNGDVLPKIPGYTVPPFTHVDCRGLSPALFDKPGVAHAGHQPVQPPTQE